MEEMCETCKKWEKHFYWSHLEANRIHFSKALIGDFSKQLRLPRKFSMFFKEELAEFVELKGPSGNKWSVGLKKRDDVMFLESGWSEFVRDHMLEEEDFLVFRYMGDSCFEVLMFDPTSCEKEHAYFVKKRKNDTSKKGCPMEKERRKCSVEFVHVSSQEACSLAAPPRREAKRPRKANIKEKNIGVGDESKSRKQRTPKNPKIETLTPPSLAKLKVGGMESSICSKNLSKEFKKDSKPNARRPGRPIRRVKKSSYAQYFISQRRPVSDAERSKALELAQAIQPEGPFFIIVMQPTHVYKRFFMTIPSGFVRMYLLPRRKRTITLSIPDRKKEWAIKYTCQNSCGLSGGWNGFVQDNNLEEGDACVFELTDRESMAMKVYISRVVEEIVPRTLI